MKKLVALVLSLVMVLSLSACGNTTENSAASSDAATTSDASSAEEVNGGAELNIAIISSPSGVDDGSFNQNSYKGVEDFVAANPECTSVALKEETGDTEACRQFVEQNVADYDVIVACGFQFATIGDIADDNPDKYFILVDSTPTYEDGSDAECANIYSMCFAEQESGFFAGVAAALETKTNKVAVVNGIAYPSNVNYQYGFMCGVKYANAKYGTTAELVELPSYAGTDVTGANVGGNYVGSFADEATGKIVAEALMAEGVDVMFVAAGDSGNGVFTAAKETDNVMIIGCDADQYGFGDNGSRNIILTSVLKCMDINNERQLNAIKDGTFKGGNFTLDTTTDSTGYITADGRQQLSEDTLAKLAEAYDAVKSGAVVPAANFNGITPDTFEVK